MINCFSLVQTNSYLVRMASYLVMKSLLAMTRYTRHDLINHPDEIKCRPQQTSLPREMKSRPDLIISIMEILGSQSELYLYPCVATHCFLGVLTTAIQHPLLC